MRLFVVDYEGGLYRYVGLVDWLLSDAAFWGFQLGRRRFVFDSVLKARGRSPWRQGSAVR